ncbi:MAG: tRNA/rRNA methyltransferase [Kiritimatiellia bacterium]|jgi:tRNA/rRNA methyltransferase
MPQQTTVDFASQADRLVIILVQPQHSGNVGACIRAMNNMGLHRLVVVDPPCLDPMRVRWMAPGCDELVAGMQIVGTLDEALEGVHQAIATTARHRKGRREVISPRDFAQRHWSSTPDTVTAILFGREDFGLSKEHSGRAETLLRISTPEHASLNLGQAVLLICNHWFEEGRRLGAPASGRLVGGRRGIKTTHDLQGPHPRDERADLRRLEPAADVLVELLVRVGYTRTTPEKRVRQTARTALQRADLTIRQVEALRGMMARVDWALDHPELDPKRGRSDS